MCLRVILYLCVTGKEFSDEILVVMQDLGGINFQLLSQDLESCFKGKGRWEPKNEQSFESFVHSAPFILKVTCRSR
jgi:hypothetical protein